MKAEGHQTTLTGLDGIIMSERERSRVQDAALKSDMIVSGLIALAHYLGLARPVAPKA